MASADAPDLFTLAIASTVSGWPVRAMLHAFMTGTDQYEICAAALLVPGRPVQWLPVAEQDGPEPLISFVDQKTGKTVLLWHLTEHRGVYEAKRERFCPMEPKADAFTPEELAEIAQGFTSTVLGITITQTGGEA